MKVKTPLKAKDEHESAPLASGLEERIRTAVANTLFQQTPLLQVANVFIAIVSANIFLNYLPAWPVVTWLLAMIGVSLWRLWLTWRYRRDENRRLANRYWLRRTVYGSLLSGLLLGATSSILLYKQDMTLVYFLLLVVVGMMAGSVSSLTANLATFKAYYFSVSIPFILVLFNLGLKLDPLENILLSIDSMLIVFSMVLYFFGLNANRNLIQGFRHRFEHETLADELAEEIRRREDAQEELMLSAKIIANVKEGIVVTDHDNRIIRINDTFSRITGYTEAEVVGKSPTLLTSGKQDRQFYQRMWQSLDQFGEWEGEIWNRRKNGEVYPEWLSISVIRDLNGEVSNYVGWFRDITERKREEERLSYLAHYDVLTGLPNRKLFMERLDMALADCSERGELLAILFLDLNMFKQVNDNYGHDVGDILLREVALRLKSVLRPEDMVARLGGDEFIIMLRNLHDGSDVERVADKMLEVVKPAFHINGHQCDIGFAIGISLAPLDAVERKTLLKCADKAMYKAKQDRSRSQWFMFDGEEAQTVA